MLFNSYSFVLIFLPLVLLGWWGLRARAHRLVFLTLVSYLFYAWWDFRFVPLMILSTSADYAAGRAIALSRSASRRTTLLVLLLIFNLGLLAVFKYYDFFVGSLEGLARLLGYHPEWALLGGSRGSALLAGRNLLLTMFLGGLWHGAAWIFVVWGLYHGALLAGNSYLARLGWVPRSRPLAVAATFLSVVVGWVFFRARSVSDALAMLGSMSGLRSPEGGSMHLVDPWAMVLTGSALAICFFAPNTWNCGSRAPAWPPPSWQRWS